MFNRESLGQGLLARLQTPGALVQRVGWTTLGYVGTQVVRFATNIALTRLLAPELFGLMILLMSLRTGLELFTDIGISQNIVASRNANDPDFYRTAWTLQIIRGVLLALLSLLLIPIITIFYTQEEIRDILPFLSLFFIIGGFYSIGHPLAIKALRNKRLAFFEVVTATVGSLIIVLSVLVSPDIVGLLVGNLLGTASTVILSYLVMPKVGHGLRLRREFVFEIVGLGKWIFLMSVIYFLATNFDRLILAKYVPFAALGIYGLARSLADVFGQLSGKLGAMVIFPSVASLDLPAPELRAKLAPRRLQFLLLSALAIAALISLSDLIISILYDERYQGAADLLPWIGLATWIGVLSTINENVLLGMRKPALLAAANGAKLAGLVIFLPVGVVHSGVFGAAIAAALAEVARYAVSSVGQRVQKVGFLAQDAGATLVLFAAILSLRWLAEQLGLTGPISALFSLGAPPL